MMDGYTKLGWLFCFLTIVFSAITLGLLWHGKGETAGTFFMLTAYSFIFIIVANVAGKWGD